MGPIKLGISLKSLGLPFRRSLPRAQKLGARAIELEAVGELAPRNLTQTGRREITHLLRSHDLVVSALVCPLRNGIDVAENLEPRLEQIRDAMALAFELGPRLVVIPVGKLEPAAKPAADAEPESTGAGVLLSPRANLMRESLDALGRHGDRIGVNVALQAGLEDPADVAAYLGAFDRGSLGVAFNPAHLVLNGFNPYDAVRTLHGRLFYVHAQDARRVSPSKLATVPLGHGDIDWVQLLANFEEIGFRGHVTVLGEDPAELAAGVAFLRRFIS